MMVYDGKGVKNMTKNDVEILRTLVDMEARGELDRASFSDIPIQIYHHRCCPGISSTTIKTVMQKSWHHVGFGSEKEVFKFGNAFHCFNNEPEIFRSTYYVVPFDSKRGDDFQMHKAIANGRIIIMQSDFNMILAMSKKLWQHPEAKELLTGAEYETTYFSRCQRTGLLKKCRLDAFKNFKISDLKSTMDASPASFKWDARKFGYGISAAFYCGVTSDFYEQIINDFTLIACEKEEPNEICTYKVHIDSLAAADQQINETMDKIAAIRKDPKTWSGYALGQTIII